MAPTNHRRRRLTRVHTRPDYVVKRDTRRQTSQTPFDSDISTIRPESVVLQNPQQCIQLLVP